MKCLDHGSVDLIETYGSDERIIESARMSTDGEFRGWDRDSKLLSYLWKHKHTTPFEMAGAVFQVTCPIFVARQWFRHRTFSYNELSGRYSELPDVFYTPSIERLREGLQATDNRQGSMGGGDESQSRLVQSYITDLYAGARETYDDLLAQGIARELARIVLPVSVYTKFRVAGNVHNWCHFLGLRLDKHAQWEMREFAACIDNLLTEKFPHTMELFHESR